MLTKVLSLVTGIGTLDVYLQSQRSSSDLLFAVISGNLIINMLMVGLAALAISVSYRRVFITWNGYAACAILAALLIFIGGGGIFFSGFSSVFWTIFMPLNYLLMLEIGVILGINCLSYKHPEQPAWVQLPGVTLPSRLAFPVPRIPHSPLLRFSRSVARGH